MPVRGSDIVLILVAILFPPAAAAFVAGCGCDLLINILLTILGYIPGHIHAFWLIYKRMKAEEQFGHGRSQYVGGGRFQAVGGSAGGPINTASPAQGNSNINPNANLNTDAPPAYGATTNKGQGP